jgi:hypothetical protein
MNIKYTKQPLFWSAMSALSLGTLGGCEYCIPAMIALLAINVIYTTIRNLDKSLEIQPLA